LDGKFGNDLLCVGLVFDDKVDHLWGEELAELDIE
jgi:hypothetical protein